jgi:hypothetical protein
VIENDGGFRLNSILEQVSSAGGEVGLALPRLQPDSQGAAELGRWYNRFWTVLSQVVGQKVERPVSVYVWRSPCWLGRVTILVQGIEAGH